jgi:hypothetical protein
MNFSSKLTLLLGETEEILRGQGDNNQESHRKKLL